MFKNETRSKVIVIEWELYAWSFGCTSEVKDVSWSRNDWKCDWRISFECKLILWCKYKFYFKLLTFFDSAKLIWYFEERERVTSFDGKIEIEITTVFNYYLPILHLVYKDVAEINLTLLVSLYSIWLAAEENWMRKHIAYTFHIYKNGAISTHNVAVNIIVEGLRRFWLKYDLDFYLSLRRNNSRHRLHNQRVSILELPFDRFFVKVKR